MNTVKLQHEWTNYFRLFNEQNLGRKTRIGVFEPNGKVVTDYWLECGLPLVGIDLDTHQDPPAVQIMVGSLQHEIRNAVKISCHLSTSGEQDGLDVQNSDGRLTVLRFEENGDQ